MDNLACKITRRGVRSGTVTGTEKIETASKLVFGLLPETEPGSGKGRRLDHLGKPPFLTHLKIRSYYSRLCSIQVILYHCLAFCL